MTSKTLLIKIPDAPKDRQEIIQFLLDRGLVEEKDLQMEEVQARQGEPSHWARIAKEMADENLLGDGLGDELRAGLRESRETFAFRHDFEDRR